MTKNQLPEGVGKKIVEALKRQAEADITPVPANNNTVINSVPLTDIKDFSEMGFSDEQQVETNENLIVEEEPGLTLTFNNKENEISQPAIEPNAEESNINPSPVFNIGYTEPETPLYLNNPEPMPVERQAVKTFYTPNQIRIPSNVAVLKNLITTLPAGVTKQTGAQIIRQTLEAMGIPMNGVLKEAQDVQEELNSSTRECMLKIQEYKTNILQLEQSVQEYQKNITQINDLVSLFLLTDRK